MARDRDKEINPPASSACALHELEGLGVDPAYLGQASRAEIIDLLNTALGAGAADNPKASVILTREIAKLGGTVKPLSPPNRHRAIEELRAALPRIADASLRARLREALVLLRDNRI